MSDYKYFTENKNKERKKTRTSHLFGVRKQRTNMQHATAIYFQDM